MVLPWIDNAVRVKEGLRDKPKTKAVDWGCHHVKAERKMPWVLETFIDGAILIGLIGRDRAKTAAKLKQSIEWIKKERNHWLELVQRQKSDITLHIKHRKTEIRTNDVRRILYCIKRWTWVERMLYAYTYAKCSDRIHWRLFTRRRRHSFGIDTETADN